MRWVSIPWDRWLIRHQPQEVILHPHRALFGCISAKQDGALHFCHHAIITPGADTHRRSSARIEAAFAGPRARPELRLVRRISRREGVA
jgi:hypothetical protein